MRFGGRPSAAKLSPNARRREQPIERWVRLVLRRRAWVLVAWSVALIAGALAAQRLPALLTNRIALPGTDSDRADALLQAHFQQSSVGSFTLVVATAGNAQARLADVQTAARGAAAELPGGELVASFAADDDVVIAQIASALEPAAAKERTPAVRAAVQALPAADAYVTGLAATEHDVDAVIVQDLRKGELLIALPLAIALLVFVFRTLALLLPLVFALFTIPTTLGLVFVCARFMELTTYITNFVSLIGLGIAIDYSLLIVHRFREELAAGRTRDDAILTTMKFAGRAVTFSGMVVAVGLALLVFLPLPFLRGFGVGGLMIPAVSVLAALTLQPALLSFCGEPLDRIRLWPRGSPPRAAAAHGFWPALAGAIVRRPLPVATAAIVVLLALSVPLRDVVLGPGSTRGHPAALESVRGREVVAAALGAGATTPTSVVIDTGAPAGAEDPAVDAAIDRLLFALTDDPEVTRIYFTRGNRNFVDPTGRFLHLLVLGRAEFGATESRELVARLRSQHVAAAAFPAGVSVVVGGVAPAGVDFVAIVVRWFPWLVLGVLGASYLLLTWAFRSVVVPLKAVVLNSLSVTAASGLSVAVFGWGWGQPFGLPVYDQFEAWIPVMVFAMVFGLSMDYEVFLVGRIREEWDNLAADDAAIVAGLAKTGRLVTVAGLIMVAAFAGLVAGSIVGLQQLGFTLAAAILLDVTIVRALLLPASMKLLGRWNWYLPRPLTRLLGR